MHQYTHSYHPIYRLFPSPSTHPIRPIQFPRRQDLTPRPLSPNRITHRMSPPPISSHIPQARDIRAHLFTQLVLDLHTG